jgi:hypothetical protein
VFKALSEINVHINRMKAGGGSGVEQRSDQTPEGGVQAFPPLAVGKGETSKIRSLPLLHRQPVEAEMHSHKCGIQDNRPKGVDLLFGINLMAREWRTSVQQPNTEAHQ